jgi:hypothetical protein
MHHKQQEFLDLQQGPNSVYEYNKKFNYLVQYGAHHLDTNEKKSEQFRKGLNAQLQERLVLFHVLTFNTLVSSAIDQEGVSQACLDVEEKKSKRVMSGPSGGSSGGGPSKYSLFYTLPTRRLCHPLPPQCGHRPWYQ